MEGDVSGLSKQLSAKLGIMFASLALILSIFAMLMQGGSVAWFAENDKATANGMAIEIDGPPDIIGDIEIFPIYSIALSGNEDQGNYNIYTFSATKIEDPALMKLGVFSPLDAKRQILIRIPLAEGVSSVRVVAESTSSSYMVEDEETLIYKENNPLSSVVEFYAVSNVEKSGDYYVIPGQNADRFHRFASITEQEGEVEASFSPTIDLYSTQSGDDDAVFIIVDYYEESINYVLDFVNALIMENKTDVTAGDNLEFISDFKITVYGK